MTSPSRAVRTTVPAGPDVDTVVKAPPRGPNDDVSVPLERPDEYLRPGQIVCGRRSERMLRSDEAHRNARFARHEDTLTDPETAASAAVDLGELSVRNAVRLTYAVQVLPRRTW
jgi:hypothetical protein